MVFSGFAYDFLLQERSGTIGKGDLKMIPVPHFFPVVGGSVSGGTGTRQGQAAWQHWGLACRIVFSLGFH